MTTFNSPNFSKTTQNTAQTQSMREWTVGEPEPPMQQVQQNFSGSSFNVPAEQLGAVEQNIKQARQERVAELEKISPAAKERLEMLAGIGRLTKDITIGKYTFSLRTLKNKETREAALSTFNVATNIEVGYEARKQQLARAIYKINGTDIGIILGNDLLETKLAFIDDVLEESVVAKLFEEFSKLKDEAKTQFEIKTEQEAKEVGEDLKK